MAAVAARSATKTKEVTSPPSLFAALLRRSKFASYDPHIGQVYTTFGGDAHRGNYGLKRPLALRKREAYIRIGAIDSRHQQTEWDNGGREVKWIKKFEEVGRRPQIAYDSELWRMAGPTGQVKWEVDTEFSPKLQKKKSDKSKSIDEDTQILSQNVNTMSPKRFERHLQKLRTLRPKFQSYLEDVAREEAEAGKRNPSVKSTNLLEQSQYNTSLHKSFLSRHAKKEMSSLDSRAIEQQLHPSAGLSYTHLSDLQHFLMRNPSPGRIIDAYETKRSVSLLTAFAGTTAELPKTQSEAIPPMDWKTLVEHGVDTEKGISNFRMTNALLIRAPAVVGNKPEGLAGVHIKTMVSSQGKTDMTRPNPYLPWTREYVAHVSDDSTPRQRKITSSRAPPPKKEMDLDRRKVAGPAQDQILVTLSGMLKP